MAEADSNSPTSTTTSSSEEMDGVTAGSQQNQTADDKASYKKSNKPLMEKKRRARINNCLNQLKSIVLQATQKDSSQYSKLEKADILELTVKHLKGIQQLESSDPDAYMHTERIKRYKAGFMECANEIIRYLTEADNIEPEARTRILSHLAAVVNPFNSPTSAPVPILPAPPPVPPRPPLNIQVQCTRGTPTLSDQQFLELQRQLQVLAQHRRYHLSLQQQQVNQQHQDQQLRQQLQQQSILFSTNSSHIFRNNAALTLTSDTNNNNSDLHRQQLQQEILFSTTTRNATSSTSDVTTTTNINNQIDNTNSNVNHRRPGVGAETPRTTKNIANGNSVSNPGTNRCQESNSTLPRASNKIQSVNPAALYPFTSAFTTPSLSNKSRTTKHIADRNIQPKPSSKNQCQKSKSASSNGSIPSNSNQNTNPEQSNASSVTSSSIQNANATQTNASNSTHNVNTAPIYPSNVTDTTSGHPPTSLQLPPRSSPDGEAASVSPPMIYVTRPKAADKTARPNKVKPTIESETAKISTTHSQRRNVSESTPRSLKTEPIIKVATSELSSTHRQRVIIGESKSCPTTTDTIMKTESREVSTTNSQNMKRRSDQTKASPPPSPNPQTPRQKPSPSQQTKTLSASTISTHEEFLTLRISPIPKHISPSLPKKSRSEHCTVPQCLECEKVKAGSSRRLFDIKPKPLAAVAPRHISSRSTENNKVTLSTSNNNINLRPTNDPESVANVISTTPTQNPSEQNASEPLAFTIQKRKRSTSPTTLRTVTPSPAPSTNQTPQVESNDPISSDQISSTHSETNRPKRPTHLDIGSKPCSSTEEFPRGDQIQLREPQSQTSDIPQSQINEIVPSLQVNVNIYRDNVRIHSSTWRPW